ncbi:MAG: FtsX-like permease family protein [Acidobacteria bacterium]|nr:FtsX-like permease family protein [Acidobacteriota bacterium]
MISQLRTAWSRIGGLFRRRALDERLNEEIDSHLEMLAEGYEASGMDPAAARQAARREFGRIGAIQESYRERSGIPAVENLIYDTRLACRSLLRDRLVFAVCVLSLGLAGGVGTAIFSAYEAAVLRPLPFPGSENLVLAMESSKAGRRLVSLPNLEDWRARASAFFSLSAFGGQTMALSGGGKAERVRGGFVSHDFFQTLEVEAAMGQLNLQARTRQAVISHRLWTTYFNGRPDIVGAGLTLNGEAYSVLGVLRPGFVFVMDDTDVWVPVENFATSMALARNMRSFYVLGRLRSGVAIETAEAALRATATDLAKQYPEANGGHSAMVMRWREFLAEGVRGTLRYLLAAVGLLLLVACANVGGMLASRAAARRREFALQVSLGAQRWRIVRQVLIEGIAIGAASVTAALLIAAMTTTAWPSILPQGAMQAGPPEINGPVLAFCLTVCLFAGLFAALLPAFGLAGTALGPALRDGDSHSTVSKAAGTRRVFLVAQVAASTILVLGGAALLESLQRLWNTNLGIANSANVLTMEYRVNRAKFASRQQQWEFHRQVVESVKEIPGVRSAALARAVPSSGNGGSIEFRLPGAGSEGAWAQAVFNTVTADYFHTMGIPLVSGRSCDGRDIDGGQSVVLVNDLLARRLWPKGDAIGQTLVVKDWATATVIGVVGANRQNDIRREAPAQLYACYSQNPGTLAAVALRFDGDLNAIAESAKKAVWRVDGDQAVWKIRTMQSLIDLQTRNQRTTATLMSIFAFFAACLALSGVYGIARYDAERRLKDLGIRLALGASRSDIFLRSVGPTLTLVVGGVLAGGAAGPLFIEKFAAAPLQTPLIAFCGLALIVAGSLAAARPGLQALRTNPVDVLRHD